MADRTRVGWAGGYHGVIRNRDWRRSQALDRRDWRRSHALDRRDWRRPRSAMSASLISQGFGNRRIVPANELTLTELSLLTICL